MTKYSEKFLNAAHDKSIYHEAEITSSDMGGCFYCKKTFQTNTIVEWTDIDSKIGKTACCPHCGIDSVLSNKFPIEDQSFLDQMNQLFFSSQK